MIGILLGLFSVALLLLCGFIVLLVLMQRPSANSGMGAALGGGAAEQAFGGETTNVLTRGTIYSIIGFFVICLLLYLGAISTHQRVAEDDAPAILRGIGQTGDEVPAVLDIPAVAEEAETSGEVEVSAPAETGEVLGLDDLESQEQSP